jgi:branched-chain amino acid aminotransferase
MSTIKLQKPKWVHFGGRLRAWEDAVFHISHEAVLRGLNVFEGLKAYRQPDGRFGIVAMRRHYDRLRRSARLMHMPFETTYEAFLAAHVELIGALAEPGNDIWVRATLYGEEGHWGEGSTSQLVLTAYQTPRGRPPAGRSGVSTWQRAPDDALPCRIKTSSNYQVARFAKIEGRERGFPEMVLLNSAGRVAEAIGSCVAIVRNGTVYTPPAWEGALESITLDIVEALCSSMQIRFERRPVDRTELSIADEIALVGTLVEVTPIENFDGRQLEASVIFGAIADRYHAAATGEQPHPAVDLFKFEVDDRPAA